MSLIAWQHTLSTTAEILVNGADIEGQYPRLVYISSASATIYLGDASVNTTDGYPFGTSSSPFTIMLQPGDTLYGVAASGTPTVQLMVTRIQAATE